MGPACHWKKNRDPAVSESRERGAPTARLGPQRAGPGREGKPGGWLAASGPSARVRGGVRLGFSFFFFSVFFSKNLFQIKS